MKRLRLKQFPLHQCGADEVGMLVADVVHLSTDGVKIQRIFIEKMVDGRWQLGIGIVEPAVELVVADDERHPVVHGRNARIGGGGQQHEGT